MEYNKYRLSGKCFFELIFPSKMYSFYVRSKNIRYWWKNKFFYLFTVIVFNSSCKKFIEIGPPKTQIISTTVYTDDVTATSAVNGIYSQMISNGAGFASGGQGSISLLAGLSSDEFQNYISNADLTSFYTNSLIPTNSYLISSLWQPAYQYIYYSNNVIEGVANSSALTIATS